MIEKIKFLFAHKNFMKYFKNTSWLFGEKILRIFSGLFVGVWVAKFLGPGNFGLLSYAQSFVGLFLVIASLGLDGIVVRELVKDQSRREELLGTAFWLKVMGAIAVLIIIIIAINFTSNNRYTNTLILIVTAATIFQSFNVIDFYFQSKVLSRYAVYANIINLILSSLLKIALILFEAPLIAFVYVVVFDSITLAIGLIFFYVKQSSDFKVQKFLLNKSTAILLLKDSWPLILSGIVISIYMKIDQVMLKEMLGSEAVGQYAVAVRLSEAWYFIPMVITSSLFPAIVNAKKISEDLYYNRLQKLYDTMFWTAILIAITVTLFSDWAVSLLFGEQYDQVSGILKWHIWAGVLVFFGAARHKWVLNQNLQRYEIYIDLIGALTNVVLNFIFIKLYGVYGAAFATLASYFLGSIIVSFFIKEFHISLKMLLKSFLLPIRLLNKK
jgi:O-antigen/teichoic acid export membrane protein